jgi:hypothetical protein
MPAPEIFKYGGLISVPLFGVIAYWLICQIPTFDLRKLTISRSILFLHGRFHRSLFRLNFISKALLDLGFAIYVLDRFNLTDGSPVYWSLIVYSVLFASLSLFIEGKYWFIHLILVYSSGLLWAFSQIFLSYLTNDNNFLVLTVILTTVVVTLPLGYVLTRKTNINAYVQVVCISLLYVWMLVFAFRYL